MAGLFCFLIIISTIQACLASTMMLWGAHFTGLLGWFCALVWVDIAANCYKIGKLEKDLKKY